MNLLETFTPLSTGLPTALQRNMQKLKDDQFKQSVPPPVYAPADFGTWKCCGCVVRVA